MNPIRPVANASAARFLVRRVNAVRAELEDVRADHRSIARVMEQALARDLLTLESRLADVRRRPSPAETVTADWSPSAEGLAAHAEAHRERAGREAMKQAKKR